MPDEGRGRWRSDVDMHGVVGRESTCYKRDKQITKNDKRKRSRDTRFNVKNPFQHRRENHGRQLANTSLYRRVFINTGAYLII
jgi:hypothetical protein